MATDYGTDVNTVLSDGSIDLDPYWALVSGGPAVCQAIARRLTSEGIIDDDEYGYDVRDLINAPMGGREKARAQHSIEAQCLADERVKSVDVTLTIEGSALTIAIDGLLSDDEPFRLVLSVSAVTTTILEAS